MHIYCNKGIKIKEKKYKFIILDEHGISHVKLSLKLGEVIDKNYAS
jgi:hypothetical protein